MIKGIFKIAALFLLVFVILGAGIIVFFQAPWKAAGTMFHKNHAEQQTRIIIPQNLNTRVEETDNSAELLAREESMTAKINLAEGEVIVSILTGNYAGNPVEEQFVAYRNLLEMESPIYLTFICYDEASRSYKRLWNAPTAATRPGTISLYTQDLLGDRSTCVLLSGMNGLGEHTLTIFHINQFTPSQSRDKTGNTYYSKIAELRIDGNITVREEERSQAYQMGIGRGMSYTIAAYGRDFESSNLLDQVEIVYAYNERNGLYEQKSRTRIPGSQIEQRRVQELLGNVQAFEEYITGLWYYTTPQGTIDMNQYIYFNPSSQEIIFYGDETQQVFNWQNSTATRYGIYISSQNISVTTLRRSIDIELESLSSIKIRVFEDVRLKINVNPPWDGSYRKAGPPENHVKKPAAAVNAYIDACYDSSIGRIRFFPNGAYEINTKGTTRQGNYAFFNVDDKELLELRSTELRSSELRSTDLRSAEQASAENRPAESRSEGSPAPQRETYLVEAEPDRSSAENNPGEKPQAAAGSTAAPNPSQKDDEKPPAVRKSLTLLRVRLGAKGIQRLHEGAILLTLASE